MNTNRRIKIDTDKFKRAFKSRGLKPTVVAREAGYENSWLTSASKRGFVTPPQVIVLEKIGISLDEYVFHEKEEPPMNAEISHDGMTQGDLYETISDAVQDAFRSCKAELQRVIHDAMRDALGGANETL